MSYKEHEELLLRSKMSLGITDIGSEALRFPQAIAHRGFKVQFPENTLIAFEGAAKAGAHAIETDLHLSKDGVVMISHDATLKRCFGVEGKLIDYDYSYLKTLRTLEAPHVPMPTLKEVLEFMCQPAVLDMWLLLDIKADNDAEDIIRETASAIHSVNPSQEFWANRIVLGCWTLSFLPVCGLSLQN
ncbi:PLC-like phosphodiesterase [Tuber borchii]|uniref:PLC-like phosphodiesterase n=1 Tax=Tuber borchii TaxID=42251 RepID=A0A2T6ZSP3_TUBBO|nr:PLC-like phosphodiesterase [Tuber borchii]